MAEDFASLKNALAVNQSLANELLGEVESLRAQLVQLREARSDAQAALKAREDRHAEALKALDAARALLAR